jgi:hypothetical protein
VIHVGEAESLLVDELLECLLGQVVELHGDAEWFFGDGLREGNEERSMG